MARDPAGPNVFMLEPVCTSFCRFGLHNGGTRTFAQPEGDPARRTDSEERGNAIGSFHARLFGAVVDAGKFAVCEDPAPDGAYPKLWDLPGWQALLQRADVEVTAFDACAHGLRPLDGPATAFYRKKTWLVHRRCPGFRARMGRHCPGISSQHQHVQLRGSRPGATRSRCAEAGAYPEAFCANLTA
eukprot:2310906-Lingulodinium_polyedra.AAC.1